MPVDPEIKNELDAKLLPWDGVTNRSMFGGVCYMVQGKMFAVHTEGIVAMKLPDELRRTALGLAGVSPFYGPGGPAPFGKWIQFVVVIPDNVTGALPWLQEAHKYVASLPAPRRRKR